jgi:hypothetical protein
VSLNLNEFEATLTEMSTRSKAFQLVKEEMMKRGHWKAKSRGIPIKTNLRKSNSTDANIHSRYTHQVTYNENDFSDGL